MNTPREVELIDACRILFPSAEVDREFLSYVQLDGLKNAYRHRVWECHPDACGSDSHDTRRQTELFRRSVEAYRLLSEYLKKRKPVLPLRQAQAVFGVSPRIQVSARAAGEQYYDGPLPSIELKIGLFLYYSGTISYQALVRALLWQRSQRPPIGDLAVKWGWLSEEDVVMVLHATHIVGSFGERAVNLGLMTASQLNILLIHQRTMQQPIGKYLVSHSLMSELSLQHHLRQLARHNRLVQEERSDRESDKKGIVGGETDEASAPE